MVCDKDCQLPISANLDAFNSKSTSDSTPLYVCTEIINNNWDHLGLVHVNSYDILEVRNVLYTVILMYCASYYL